jgi:hypothetical protein
MMKPVAIRRKTPKALAAASDVRLFSIAVQGGVGCGVRGATILRECGASETLNSVIAPRLRQKKVFLGCFSGGVVLLGKHYVSRCERRRKPRVAPAIMRRRPSRNDEIKGHRPQLQIKRC